MGISTLSWYQISTLSWYQISVYRNKASKVRINCILTSPFEYMCVRLNLHNKGTFFHWATFLHPVTLDDFSQWRGLFNGKPAHCCCFQKLEAFTGRHFSAKLLIENFKCALIRRQNNENLAFWYLTACSLTPTYLTPCNLAPGKWLLTLSVVGMKLKLLCRKLAWGAWPDQDQFIQIGSICTSLDGAKLLTMLWIGSCDYQVHPRECGAIRRAVAGSFKWVWIGILTLGWLLQKGEKSLMRMGRDRNLYMSIGNSKTEQNLFSNSSFLDSSISDNLMISEHWKVW